jgi:NitT/TauT family transport system substrate-binding protein
VEADFEIERMPSWQVLRAAFREGRADMAFIICPEALQMFSERPDFRWVGLLHRNGNQLIINRELAQHIELAENPKDRKPDGQVAEWLLQGMQSGNENVYCGLPAPRATHSVVFYKYLRDHDLKMGTTRLGTDGEVTTEIVRPGEATAYMRKRNNRSEMACTQQSLPWGDVIEERGDGKIAWYSKDVLVWPNGHVECIVIASDKALREKRAAVVEVLQAINQAGKELETARKGDEALMGRLVGYIQEHVPEHSRTGILDALDIERGGIRYDHLSVDDNAVGSLREIMSLAIEAGILEEYVDLESFAIKQLETEGTVHE